jgi:hypothetical protein
MPTHTGSANHAEEGGDSVRLQPDDRWRKKDTPAFQWTPPDLLPTGVEAEHRTALVAENDLVPAIAKKIGDHGRAVSLENGSRAPPQGSMRGFQGKQPRLRLRERSGRIRAPEGSNP